jgi:DNA-directed RNA polymerase specialized sigma24 family protein
MTYDRSPVEERIMHDRGSVSEWIRKAKDGSSDAASELWKRFGPRLVALARTKLAKNRRREADEEDVVQKVFMRFIRKAQQGGYPNLNTRSSLWALLWEITDKEALDLRRYQRRILRNGRGQSALGTQSGAGEGPFDRLPGSSPSPDTPALMCEAIERLGAVAHALHKREKQRTTGPSSKLPYPQLAIELANEDSIYAIAAHHRCSVRTVQRRREVLLNAFIADYGW